MELHLFDVTYEPDIWAQAEAAPEQFYGELFSSAGAAGCSLEISWPYANKAMLLVVRSDSEFVARQAFLGETLKHVGVLGNLPFDEVPEAIVNVAPEPKARCKECKRKPPPHAPSCKWNK